MKGLTGLFFRLTPNSQLPTPNSHQDVMNDSIQGYTISGYGRMIVDPQRTEPYVRALKAAIKPGAVVLDIGTGTGFFAVLACNFGASKVYAVEPDDAIVIAKQVAIDNHCADKIEFIQGISSQIDLPERVDVIICDLRGVMPLYQHHLSEIADAKQRHLKPDGVQIPLQDSIWVTLISNADYYTQEYSSFWEDAYGCNLSANRQFLVNTWQKQRLEPEQYLASPQLWQTLDYTQPRDSNAEATLTWTIDRPGIVHGLGIWFDTVLAEGIGFSNAPDRPECIYGNAFIPLSEPVDLAVGDRVTVTIKANLVGDDYIWSWYTQVETGTDPHSLKADFQQSTFLSVPRSPKSLQQRSDSYVPIVNESAKIDAVTLNLMTAGKSLGEIAHQLHQQFPDRFATVAKAQSYAADLARQYR
jgi:type I protein arginine methyltransferase